MPRGTKELTLVMRAEDRMSAGLREVAAAARDFQKAATGVSTETAKATDTMRGFGNVMLSPANMLKMSIGFAVMGTGIGTIQSAVEGAKYAMIGFNSILEQSSVAFTVMTGSADIAQQHLEELQAFARVTPFDFPELLEASRRLQAYGVDVQDIIPTLTTLGNITAGVGREKLPQLILAFGQVQAATRLTGMELRQFSETGVPLLGALAIQMGKTTGEIQQMVSEGLVSFRDVRKALESMAGEGGRFGDMMQKQSRTFEGAMSNIRDAASQIGGRAFKGLFESARDMAVGIADNLTNLNVALNENAIAWEVWSTTVTVAMAVAGGAVVGRIAQMVTSLGRLGGAFVAVRAAATGALTGPGGIAAGMAGLMALWNKLWEEQLSEWEHRAQEWGEVRKGFEFNLLPDEEAWAQFFFKPSQGIEDLTKHIRKMKEEMHRMGTIGERFVSPQTTADVIATAVYIANIRAEAEKLAKSGDLEGAAKLLESLSISMAEAANQAVAWSRETEKGSKAVKEVLEEIIPVMEQLNRENAFRVWREEMKALLAEGDLEGVIAGFEAIGWTAKATAQEILEMAEENQDAMDALTKKGADQVRDYFEAQERAARKLADAAIAEAERIVQGTSDAITAALGRGGTLEEGMAAFAEAEWIRDMGQRIKAALAAGLTPDPELIAAYGTTITNTMDIQRKKAKELEDALIQIKKDSLAAQAKLDADYMAQKVKDLEYQGRQEYEASQQRLRQQIIEVNGIKFTLEGLKAWQENLNRASERQARAERLEEIGREIGFQEFRLQTSLAAASDRERAQQILLIRQLREQLLAAETGKPLVMQVNGHELGRVTGWAQNDLTRMLARFGV